MKKILSILPILIGFAVICIFEWASRDVLFFKTNDFAPLVYIIPIMIGVLVYYIDKANKE